MELPRSQIFVSLRRRSWRRSFFSLQLCKSRILEGGGRVQQYALQLFANRIGQVLKNHAPDD
jgi:hypothetical protein